MNFLLVSDSRISRYSRPNVLICDHLRKSAADLCQISVIRVYQW